MEGTERAKQRVWDRIEASSDALLAFLTRYVQHQSVNPGRAPEDDPGETESCQRWLWHELEGMGVFDAVDIWEGAPAQSNLAAVIRGKGGYGKPLMYNGHTDTVGVSTEQRRDWIGGEPWSGHVADGRLYGRGATDMKAGNAAFVWAAKTIRSLGIDLSADLAVTISIGEETSEAAIGPLSVLDRGYRAPLVINGEPTNLRIAPAGMGWFFFKLTVQGKSLHPAARYSAVFPQAGTDAPAGVDAIEKARKIMDALADLDRDWGLHQKHPLMPPGGMNLGPVSIQGGGYQAEMPPSCEVVYAVVVSPARTCDDVVAEIRQVVDGVSAADSWLRAHPPWIDYPVIHMVLEPVDLSLDHPGVTALARAFQEALGRRPAFGCLPGPCDANIMAAAGQSVVIFGPGDLSFGAHGANEFVPTRDVVDACKVYAGMIVDWCGLAEGRERNTTA